MKPFVVLDYETRSEVDISVAGAWEYSKHPTTEVLCLGYQIGDEPARIWVPQKNFMPSDLASALTKLNIDFVAHNALFEKAITINCLFKKYKHLILKSTIRSVKLHDRRWNCTASRARALSLPGKLEEVLIGLKAPYKKDMQGHRLMLKMCKPRKPTKNNKAKWHESPEDFERLFQYCLADVRGEAWLHKKLLPLSHAEKKVWQLDQHMNTRGLYVDIEAVKAALYMISKETIRMNKEVVLMTGGRIQTTNQRDAVLKYVRRKGFDIDNMQAKHIQERLDSGEIHGKAKRLLEIRQSLSKTSTGKYEAFLRGTGEDNIIRDYLIYHGAGPGRWSGARIQPQNFPTGRKNKVKVGDYALALATLKSKDIELMRLLYGDILSTLSTLLRSMIIAPPDEMLYVADYSQIEVRILFWLAGELSGLQAFRDGKDLYREMAMEIYDLLSVLAVTDDQRDIGKRSILGCGFNMGWLRFKENAKKEGDIDIPDAIAKKAVKAYRNKFKRVVQLWTDIEDAAVTCVLSGRETSCAKGKIRFVKEKDFLFMILPSGRRIAYHRPSVEWKKTPWGDMKRQLHYYSVHPKTKKYAKESTYGGKLVENAVQGTARDIMVNGMFKARKKKYNCRLTVHDELINSIKKAFGSIEDFIAAVTDLPSWAKGCPIAAGGWADVRYRK